MPPSVAAGLDADPVDPCFDVACVLADAEVGLLVADGAVVLADGVDAAPEGAVVLAGVVDAAPLFPCEPLCERVILVGGLGLVVSAAICDDAGSGRSKTTVAITNGDTNSFRMQ